MNNLNEKQLLEVENKYWVDMNLALSRLKENRDFKTVILDGYFKDKAINGVSLLARDAIIRNGERSAVMEDLIAISSLEDFFITIESLGSVSPDDDNDEE